MGWGNLKHARVIRECDILACFRCSGQSYRQCAAQGCVYTDAGRGIFLYCSGSKGPSCKARPLVLCIFSHLCELTR